MNLREKINQLFDTFFPEQMSNQEVLKELDRRGKLDTRKIMGLMFILIEEIEALQAIKPKK